MELSEVTIKYLLSCSTILHRVKNKFFGMPLSQAFWIYALSLIHKSYAYSLFNSVYEEWDSFLDQTSINDRFFFNSETSQFNSKSTKPVEAINTPA